MSKKTKGIIAILVVLLVATIAFLCYTYAKDFGGANQNNNIQTINTTNTNTVSNNVENSVSNNTINNTTVEPKAVEEPKKEPKEQENTTNSEVQEDSEEDKAIAIVKNDWGDTDGFAFKVEQINGDGSYVISVRNDDSIALEWYTVYPKTGKFSK